MEVLFCTRYARFHTQIYDSSLVRDIPRVHFALHLMLWKLECWVEFYRAAKDDYTSYHIELPFFILNNDTVETFPSTMPVMVGKILWKPIYKIGKIGNNGRKK